MNKTELLKEAERCYKDCHKRNWDGYDAEPLNRKSVDNVKRFLEELCGERLPKPDLCSEPTGDLGMEWRRQYGSSKIKQDMIMALSIDEKKEISYAFISADLSSHNMVKWNGKKIPDEIKFLIKKFDEKNKD